MARKDKIVDGSSDTRRDRGQRTVTRDEVDFARTNLTSEEAAVDREDRRAPIRNIGDLFNRVGDIAKDLTHTSEAELARNEAKRNLRHVERGEIAERPAIAVHHALQGRPSGGKAQPHRSSEEPITNQDAKKLQAILNKEGMTDYNGDALEIDNVIGPKSASAISKWNQAHPDQKIDANNPGAFVKIYEERQRADAEAKQKQEADKVAAEKAVTAKAEADKIEAEKAAADKAAADKAQAEAAKETAEQAARDKEKVTEAPATPLGDMVVNGVAITAAKQHNALVDNPNLDMRFNPPDVVTSAVLLTDDERVVADQNKEFNSKKSLSEIKEDLLKEKMNVILTRDEAMAAHVASGLSPNTLPYAFEMVKEIDQIQTAIEKIAKVEKSTQEGLALMDQNPDAKQHTQKDRDNINIDMLQNDLRQASMNISEYEQNRKYGYFADSMRPSHQQRAAADQIVEDKFAAIEALQKIDRYQNLAGGGDIKNFNLTAVARANGFDRNGVTTGVAGNAVPESEPAKLSITDTTLEKFIKNDPGMKV